MLVRSHAVGFALLAAVLVSGCGGGGSGSAPVVTTPSSGSATTMSEVAISSTNALGTPMTDLASDNSSTSSLQSIARSTESVTLGSCQTNAGGGSYEFFAPDKNGDANSTEQQYFYDTSCAQIARDIVRVYTATSASNESVARTTKLYAINNATPIATKTETNVFSGAKFDQYGFPIAADGFIRTSTGSLVYNGNKSTAADEELIMGVATTNVESFCSDSAGYNASGIPATGETFGWQGGVASGGTRTLNADGSVTWSATRTGTSFKAPVGQLAIATGTPNTSCPIATPMFTLTGGTSIGTHTLPAVATYKSGLLINLTITNATLSNGNTLNVVTNTGVSPTNSAFITGTIAASGTTVATFSVNAFGDGTLTMSSGGAQFVITDWHVVQ